MFHRVIEIAHAPLQHKEQHVLHHRHSQYHTDKLSHFGVPHVRCVDLG